jgi:hypothetical protein
MLHTKRQKLQEANRRNHAAKSNSVKGNHRNPQILRVGAKKLVAAALASQQDDNSVSQASASQQSQNNVGIEGDNLPILTRRGPYKMTECLIQTLIASIEEVPDGPIEMHIGCVGITRETYFEWRRQARANPESVYAEFAQRVDDALFASWKRLHRMAAEQKPFEVLVRRHGELYPSEAMRLQLANPDGTALFSGENAFTVKIELHAPEGLGGARSVETPAFRIVKPDGGEETIKELPAS